MRVVKVIELSNGERFSCPWEAIQTLKAVQTEMHRKAVQAILAEASEKTLCYGDVAKHLMPFTDLEHAAAMHELAKEIQAVKDWAEKHY